MAGSLPAAQGAKGCGMTPLPYLLLLTTLSVRLLLALESSWGWYLDLLTVPGWLWLYRSKGLGPLMPIPLVFGALDVIALRNWR